MADINPQFNIYQSGRGKQNAWYRRWYVYAGIFALAVLVFGVINLGFAYNTIVVDNKVPKEKSTLWETVTGFLGLNSGIIAPFKDPYPMPEPEESRFDVLILGMRGENGEDDTGQWLTDTIIVLSYDKNTQKAAMISIPRDLYIDMAVPEFDDGYKIKGKINEVYIRGASHGSGIGLAKQVMSKISGVYIDKAVVFDFKAFEGIIDTLGGIDIYLDKPFIEPRQWGYPFELPAGKNHLDSKNALYYVRSRYSTNDFDRARRQQEVVQAIKNKALSLGFLSNPLGVITLFNELKGDIRTDFQIWEIKDILKIAEAFHDNENIKHYIMTTNNILEESKAPNGEYILLPKGGDYSLMRGIFKGIL